MGKLKFSDEQIEAMIKGIEDGSINEWNLPVGYYNAITDYIKRAVYKGFKASIETVSELDLPLLTHMLENVYMFGAAKTFQQTREISSLLVDNENGTIRTSREFNKIARETYDNWNDNWGVSEYNTAIAQADCALKWQDIESSKDIYPFVRYSAIGDACDICAPLDGLVLEVDDPLLDSIAPTNHFNCLCLLLKEDENAKATVNAREIVSPVIENMKAKGQDIFLNNVGKTGDVFPTSHPYFQVEPQYKEYAVNNFNLPIPEFAR